MSQRIDELQALTAVEGVLLADLAEIVPPSDLAARMKSRLTQRIQATPGLTTLRAQEGDWQPLAKGVQRKTLFRDASGSSFLIKLSAGASLPAHDHSAYEECLVLEGDIGIGDLRLTTGDFHVAAPGARHGFVTSQGGGLMYIRTQGTASAYA